MSIAEKLTTVAENVPKVYESGYGAGYNIGNGEGYQQGEQVGYSIGYGEGKRAEYDAFWDSFQNKGKRSGYLLGFSGDGWNANTFKPKYNIPVTYGYMTFRNSQIAVDLVDLCENLGISITFDGCTDFTQTFFNTKFTRIGEVNTTSASTLSSTFASCPAETIDKLILKENGSQTFSGTFGSCSKLKNIGIEGVFGNSVSFNASPLTAKSLVNVVEHLSDTASGKTLTVLKTAVNNADWSTTEYASWDALIATKPNWSFSLG